MDLIGHLAFGLIAISFLFRDILWLRVISILASLAGILYNYHAPSAPLWLVIHWNCIFIAVNALQIALLIKERRGVRLSAEEDGLRVEVFRAMAPVDFRRLLTGAEWRELPAGEVIARDGEALPCLMLIVDGTADVCCGDAVAAQLGRNQFVGEMSFLSGDCATATVRFTTRGRVLAWEKARLRGVLDRNPGLHLALEAAFNRDLLSKLKRQNQARNSA